MLDDLEPHQPPPDQHGPAKKNPQHRQDARLPHRRYEEGFAFETERRIPITPITGGMGSCGRWIPFAFAVDAMG
jgi:hypothetical protein